MLNSSRQKTGDMHHAHFGEGRERRGACYVTPDLSYEKGEGRRQTEKIIRSREHWRLGYCCCNASE